MTTFPHTATPVSHSDSLLTALFVAAVAHVILLLGLNFTIPEAQKVNKSIEITLSNTPSKKAPDKAHYLAPDHQVGAGSESKKPEPRQQKLNSQQNGDKSALTPRPQPRKPAVAQKKITTHQAESKVESSVQSVPQKPAVLDAKPKLSARTLTQQIAQLGAKIRHSHSSAENTKIKFINQVSTHKYVAAQYMKDWENKVERTGNLNYPDIARQKGFSGSLTMDVGIRPDGSIYNMRITRSSGIPALDDAAKRIVRMSAPFSALPAELLQELDILIITRVWKFSDESGITTR